jgi:GMP synthase (glutamine-hydrolysing)
LIVQTGTTLPSVRARHGDFPEWFRRGLRLRRDEVDVVDAERDALPPVGAYAGVVVTGSPAMVSERLDWSERTAQWLAQTIDAGSAVLGVCYGHQLLAHALGGRVDYHPNGREVGTVAIERLPDSDDDALFANAPQRFAAHASHQQSVLDLPAGARVLARSAHDPHHAVRYAPRAWGCNSIRSSARKSCAAISTRAVPRATAIVRRRVAWIPAARRRRSRGDCSAASARSRWPRASGGAAARRASGRPCGLRRASRRCAIGRGIR